MLWHCKIVADIPVIESQVFIIIEKITALLNSVNKCLKKHNYVSAEKHLTDVLSLYERAKSECEQAKHIPDSIKYDVCLSLISIAKKQQDYAKIIGYCSDALSCSSSGIDIALYAIRGEAYTEIGDIDRAFADFKEYRRQISIYDACRENIKAQDSIKKLIDTLLDHYRLHCSNSQTAYGILSIIRYLGDFL